MRFRLYTFFVFITLCMHGQVTIVPIYEKSDINLNEEFKLTFLVKIKGQNVTESRLYLPDFSKFHIIGSASNRNTVIIGDETVDEKVYQWVLKPLRTGSIKIGSAKVIVNGKDYYTEPFDIQVRDVALTKKNTKKSEQPYIGIELNKQNVYKNEPFSGEVKVYATTIRGLRKVKNVRLQSQPKVQTEQISYRKSDVEVIRPNLFAQTVVYFVMIADDSGMVELKPALAKTSEGEKIQSKSVALNVKPLPQDTPKGYQNAVGSNFDVEIRSDAPKIITVNKPFNVQVKLKGKGNISNVVFPKLKSQKQFSIYPPKVKRKLSAPQSNGEGVVVANYVVVPKKSGNLALKTDDFSFFNSSTGRYNKVSSPKLNVDVQLEEKLIEGETSPYEKVNEYTNNVLSTVDNPMVDTKQLMIEDHRQFPWKTLLLNVVLLLVFVVLILLFRKWQKNKRKNKNNLPSKSLGSVEESEIEIKKMLDNSIEDELLFIKKLKDDKNDIAFFNAVSDLSNGIVERSQFSDIEEVVFCFLGDEGVRFYKEIQEKVQLQKYNPVTDYNEIDKIYDAIVKLYSQISK